MTAGLFERLTGSPRLVIVGLGTLMLGAYLTSIIWLPKPDGRIVVGDAVHHYVQMRSAVVDRDLDLRNDYALLYGFDLNSDEGREWVAARLTPTGKVRNLMPVGPALLWTPLYSAALAVLPVVDGGRAAGPSSGTERLLQAVPGVTGIFAATIAALLSWRVAARLVEPRVALVGVVGVWLGSHAIYYSLVSPAYSHTASMLASTLVVWHWCSSATRWNWRTAAWSGLLVGIAALMRWQDASLIAIPCIEAVRARVSWSTRAGLLVTTGLAALLAFSPQMFVWQALYGQPFAIPQGSSFMEWTAPNLVAVLFSDNHGLFSWSPILLPAVLGLWSVTRRHRWMLLPILVASLISWYVNAAVSDWWGGEAYGARRFLSLFPLFAVGLSGWLAPDRTVRPWRVAAVGALVILNGLLLIQYQTFMKGLRTIAPYPRGDVDLWLTRFVVPFRLLRHWFLG